MAGINTTKKEAERTADEQLDKKLEFEDKFIEDLSTYFEQLADDFRVIYGATGNILTLNESYEDELSALLKKNYRNIANEFSSLVQRALNDNIDLDVYEVIPEKQNSLKEKIAMGIGAYLLLRSNYITPKIAKTVQDEIVKKVDDYIVSQAREGIVATQTQIANAVSEKIKDWGQNHSKVVATTEVQTVAEESKYIENTEINEIVQAVDSQVGSRKVWITAGDEKVRKSHEILDGKSIDAEDMFVTGLGSRMRYAGDMENGAKLEDVINCRCTVVYKFNTEIIKIYRNTIYRKKGV